MTNSKLPFPQLAPLSVLRMLWRQKYLILVVWMALAATAAYVIHQLPSIYTAEAVVLVDPQKIPERFVASTVQVSPQDLLATINQQILSSARLQNIIDEFHLYSEERQTRSPEQVLTLMRKEIRIFPDKGWNGIRAGAFRVAYEGRSPAVVASVVNRIAGLFINESLKTREERATGTTEFLDNQLQEARKTLETQEAILRQFKIRRMGELPEQESALMAALARMQAEVQGHQDALGRAEQTKVMLENTLHSSEASEAALLRSLTPVRIVTSSGAVLSGAPSGTRSSTDLRAQLESLRLRYSEDHPDVKRAKASLDRALEREKAEDEALASVRKPAPPAAPAVETAAPNPQLQLELNRERERMAMTRTQLAFANKEIETRNAAIRRLQASLAEESTKLERLPLREQELASITRDYDNSKQNYRSLLDKKMAAEMSTAMERQQQSERFTLLDPAKVPTSPVKPNRPVYMGAAACLSLALSFSLAFLIEFPKNRLLGEWELPADVRVIGCISEIHIPPAKRAASAGVSRAASWLASLFLLALTIGRAWAGRGAL